MVEQGSMLRQPRVMRERSASYWRNVAVTQMLKTGRFCYVIFI